MTSLVFGLFSCGKSESTSPAGGNPAPPPVAKNLPADQLVVAITKSHGSIVDARRSHLGMMPEERTIAIENSGNFKRALQLVYEKLGGPLFFFAREDNEMKFLIEKEIFDKEMWIALSEFLKEIPTHGLDINDYQLSQLQQAHTNFLVSEEAWSEGLKKIDALKQTEPLIVPFLMDLLEQDELPEDLEAQLMRSSYSNEDLEKFQGFLNLYEETHTAHLEQVKYSVALDARMLRSVMQVLLDFRFIKRAHPFNPTRYPSKAANSFARQMTAMLVQTEPLVESEEAGEAAPTAGKTLDLPAMEEGIDARKNLQGFLISQLPPFPLYLPLRDAYLFYQELAEREEEKAPPTISRRATRLKHGRRGNQVIRLKKRLAFEGYFPDADEHTDQFDDALKAAILHYQKTHQLKESGDVSKGTVYSLNRSLAKRAKQLRLGLQRYRESDINWERPERYVRVNIAAFWAQIWEHGELKKQHKVVVGNNDLVKRFKQGVVGHLNRTRLFNAEITSIVMNPYWRVPARIKRLELDEELIDNPDFYERNRYEVETSSSGVEIVRQTPGNHNALGRVKINFPNPHAIYMHDTPHKSTFKHSVRSQSHGCMRLQDPLEMAQFILESDNAYDEQKFQTMLDSLREKTIPLTTPIRIFVEYNVTSVSPDGKPMFLSDIYKYDRAFFNRDLPVVERYQLAAFRDGRKIPYEDVVKVRP